MDLVAGLRSFCEFLPGLRIVLSLDVSRSFDLFALCKGRLIRIVKVKRLFIFTVIVLKMVILIRLFFVDIFIVRGILFIVGGTVFSIIIPNNNVVECALPNEKMQSLAIGAKYIILLSLYCFPMPNLCLNYSLKDTEMSFQVSF